MSDGTNQITGTVTATPVIVKTRNLTFPLTVTVVPGAAGTSKVEFTTSTEAEVDAATAVWQTWPSGTVAATTSDSLVSPVTALRFTRVTGANPDKYEVVG